MEVYRWQCVCSHSSIQFGAGSHFFKFSTLCQHVNKYIFIKTVFGGEVQNLRHDYCEFDNVNGDTHFYSASCILHHVVTFYTHFYYLPTSWAQFAHLGDTLLCQTMSAGSKITTNVTLRCPEMSLHNDTKHDVRILKRTCIPIFRYWAVTFFHASLNWSKN